MSIQIFSKKDFVINKWSGGQTTQFFIYPTDSKLENRNFIFRVSSATFTTTSSVFSDFSGYQRYILAMNGRLSVSHEGLYSRDLAPYEVEYFNGDYNISSTNSLDCRDFNLIVKKDMQCNLVVAKEKYDYIPKKNGKIILFSLSDYSIDILDKTKESKSISSEQLAVLDERDDIYKLTVKDVKEPVIICEVVC